ncbi:MAG: polyphosphate--glucose phosphotransferase [Acidimicrobiales bacterium]
MMVPPEPRIGVDVGGSGIKGAIVDLSTGELLGERVRIPTPETFGLDEIAATIAVIVGELRPGLGVDAVSAPVGVGFPAVVSHGVVASPPTAHEFAGWVGQDIAAKLGDQCGVPVVVANDADVAGIAEFRFGAGHGRNGTVLVIAIGTGVGSALFVDGVLVPNTEFGKLFLPGQTEVAEHYMSDRVRSDEELSWPEWGARLDQYLRHLDRLFTPDLVIIGGGVSKKHDRYLDEVRLRCPVVPAELRNHAGIIGAALYARSAFTTLD